MKSAHIDTFTYDNLPPRELWPELIFDLPELQYPEQLNAATRLLDDAIDEGYGDKIAIYSSVKNWTYRDVRDRANAIANVLCDELGLVAGNRVLLRGPNNPMMAICWFAVLKAGGVVVATMPMLRAGEIATICNKAEISHALCDHRFMEEMLTAQKTAKALKHLCSFGDDSDFDGSVEKASNAFENVKTSQEDTALLAFTSGTTGNPKATMHFHRDILAMADTFSSYTLQSQEDEIFAGTPPIAFTFGLGAVVVFPFHARASTVLDETPNPPAFIDLIETFKATTIFTAPTAYRALITMLEGRDLSSLRKCISAGETLPKATSDAWFEKTGIRLIDGIGATEMIHIFISAAGDDIRPGSTGKPIPGYRAMLLSVGNKPVAPGEVGRLAVKGPTGCRYLADDRQKDYVFEGWNLTGDAYLVDEHGYYWYQARADDMIISGGYNIAGPEVENALLMHENVLDCAVVGMPDEQRGQIVTAFVVTKNEVANIERHTKELQDFVKQTIAPYKYPRHINFVKELPKTLTGKLQRYKLRDKEGAK